MKILIACEESQAVCIEMRKLGHEAFSCDILPCSGGHPEWHLQEDVLQVIEREHWDMMIAFPPCTHLAVSGAAWFEKKRQDGRQPLWYGKAFLEIRDKQELAKVRSKTFPGIARAMAEQWGAIL